MKTTAILAFSSLIFAFWFPQDPFHDDEKPKASEYRTKLQQLNPEQQRILINEIWRLYYEESSRNDVSIVDDQRKKIAAIITQNQQSYKALSDEYRLQLATLKNSKSTESEKKVLAEVALKNFLESKQKNNQKTIVALSGVLLPHQIKRLLQRMSQSQSLFHANGDTFVAFSNIAPSLDMSEPEIKKFRAKLKQLSNAYERKQKELKREFSGKIINELPKAAKEKIIKMWGEIEIRTQAENNG